MTADEILKSHNLKITGCRKFIVQELLNSNSALSEHEIKQALPDLFDRVTFYRSLKTLEECNIIHRIVLHDSTVKYALNNDIMQGNIHAHFHCMKCDEVMCFEMKLNTPIVPPDNYIIDSTQILLEGTCPRCSERS